MNVHDWVGLYAESAKTSIGFFWKAGWAFVMGYAISAMIQTFVPRGRMTTYLGDDGVRSVGLAALFGAASSSCSFAALAGARALIAKGAHFVAGVAFMFASTNLVIELGMLILIFLGWPYLVAEIVGGVILIGVSRSLMRLVYPATWLQEARERAESAVEEEEDFDPWTRIRSREGWRRVGHAFVGEWKMVWREITIGFTVAGFMKVLVPASVWQAIFLVGDGPPVGGLAGFGIALENAIVGPLVAAMTFIGSMGNIPLATVLASSGVAFAGIMAFIYSDLMVPPLVKVNARYYGWRASLYIAGIMFVSIVVTALVLHYGFALFGFTPEAAEAAGPESPFALDYTFVLNLLFLAVVVTMAWLHRAHLEASTDDSGDDSGGGGRLGPQTLLACACLLILTVGLGLWLAGA